jgi:hypothetical protein
MEPSSLSDNEATVHQAQQPHEAPPLEQRQAVADELRQLFASIDERARQISEDEQEDILNEAIRSVRPEYRPTH